MEPGDGTIDRVGVESYSFSIRVIVDALVSLSFRFVEVKHIFFIKTLIWSR